MSRLANRIQRLEDRRHSEGEILLLWRLPGSDVAMVADAARNAGLFVSGDRVIGADWLGDYPMPAPRWVKVSSSGRLGLTDREEEYCELALKKMIDHSTEMRSDPTLTYWTDAELWHFALGVET